MNARTLTGTGISLLAIAIWLGGLVVLGAIVAPTVFGHVPAPTSADAMTLVFRRFDRVALSCAAAAIVGELLRVSVLPSGHSNGRVGRMQKHEWLRIALTVTAAALAVIEALWLSPAISKLHEQGAIRGLGPLGAELQRLHGFAEANGKAQAVVLTIVLLLVAFSRKGVDAHIAPGDRLDTR